MSGKNIELEETRHNCRYPGQPAARAAANG